MVTCCENDVGRSCVDDIINRKVFENFAAGRACKIRDTAHSRFLEKVLFKQLHNKALWYFLNACKHLMHEN